MAETRRGEEREPTMGKKKKEGKDEEGEKMEEEGQNLLGQPKFKKLENGRLKCVETGHELPAHSKESYARGKHCRLGLIDAALARSKPPLNMFHQDPLSRSKLICKLTGVTINKSEEHIWKHINGRRFLNMLEKKEDERQMEGEMLAEQGQQTQERMSRTKAKGLKKKKKEDKNALKDISEVRNSSNMDNSSEGDDFWMPPVGNRWDFDEGGDRWDSSLESESGTEPAKEEVIWWMTYGNQIPNLQRMARRILSLTTSSSSCERNWSTFEGIHTKKRNRLNVNQLNNLAYVQLNAKLMDKQKMEKERNVDVLFASDAQEWIVDGGDDEEVKPGTRLTWEVVGEASEANKMLQPRRSFRIKELREDDFQLEEEDEHEINEFDFESDEDRVLEEYGEEEVQLDS